MAAEQTRPARRSRPRLRLRVLRTERVTPHMVRVVLGGEEIAGFTDNDWADHYVKLTFTAPDGEETTRTYTVRRFDAEAGELTVDFVHHGDEGVAGPWAAAARPGDELLLSGPGGAYSPDPDADWYLLAGDESALPALGSILERLPAGARAHVFVEVADATEEQKLDTPADAEITWLHRGAVHAGGPESVLVDAVTAFEFPAGRVSAFVHGEAGAVMKRLRPYLLKERGLSRDQLSISGYWRVGDTEADFRKWKAALAAAESAAPKQ